MTMVETSSPEGLGVEEPEEELFDTVGQDDDAALETDGEQPESTTEPTWRDDEAQWGNVLAGSPQRISELSPRQHAKAIEKLNEGWQGAARTVAQQEYQRGLQEGMQRATAEAEGSRHISRFADLFESDRDAFNELAEEDPDGAARFFASRAKSTPKGQMSAEFAQANEEMIGRLRQYPAAYAAMTGKTYPQTAAGLIAYTRDVEQAISRAQATNGSDAEAQAARQRQEAASARKSVPKPAVTGGAALAGPLTFERVAAMTTEQIVELEKKPGGKEAVDKALAAGPRK